jgi:transcriptional regulator with GAF, ATPase, and Fis domain
MMEHSQHGDFDRLHDMIAGSEDLKGVLDGVAGFAARALTRSTGERIECAVTLRRRRRSATIAGSSDDAVLLDRIEQTLGEGPCVEALKVGHPVVLSDAFSDPCWPRYSESLLQAGCRSAMGVPLTLGDQAAGVLNLFAPVTGAFTRDAISDAEAFAEMASRILRLAVRIAGADQLAEDLRTAMQSRTVIDVACGMIMAQNRCSQAEAFEILKRASSVRNQKLHGVAEEIVTKFSGNSTTAAHFES